MCVCVCVCACDSLDKELDRIHPDWEWSLCWESEHQLPMLVSHPLTKQFPLGLGCLEEQVHLNLEKDSGTKSVVITAAVVQSMRYQTGAARVCLWYRA